MPVDYRVETARPCRPPGLPLGVHVLDYPPEAIIEVYESAKGFRRFKWPSLARREGGGGKKEKDSRIQSMLSRRRAGFALGASEPGWWAMTTLTYRIPPSTCYDVKRHLTRWKDRVRKEFGSAPMGWFLEFQGRGAAHYHVFHPLTGGVYESAKGQSTRWISRKGKMTELLSGEVGEYLSSAWIDIVGDKDSRFVDFQRGGITEKFRTPDAAGRYISKEANKSHQKEAPYHVSRWWHMSRELRAEFKQTESIKVVDWSKEHGDIALARVWPRSEWKTGGTKEAKCTDYERKFSLKFGVDLFDNSEYCS